MPEAQSETLRTVLRRFATGVAVVTTWDGERPWGTTVNSFSSVSLRPPLVLVAFDRGRRIVPALRQTGRYAVNILGEDNQALSDCFAGGPRPAGDQGVGSPAAGDQVVGSPAAGDQGVGSPAAGDRVVGSPAAGDRVVGSSDDRSELCGAAWHPGTTGLPILDGVIASLECTVVDVHSAGDHDLYIARVDAAAAGGDHALPLLYYSGRYLRIERASLHDLEGKPER